MAAPIGGHTNPLRLHGSDQLASARSAAAMVPAILDVTAARSVVDVGCGAGNWLATFAALGIDDFLGVDGFHIPIESLHFPADRFVAHDLTTPLGIGRKFDIAMSLEVAEHLPETKSVTFVESLTSLSDVVVFSAAVPFQTGPGHINERWPAYWAERFSTFGFLCVDCLRPLLWERDEIEDYYAQNVMVYARPASLHTLRTTVRPGVPRAMIHPRRWEAMHRTPPPPGVRGLPAYVSFHGTQVARSLLRAFQSRTRGRALAETEQNLNGSTIPRRSQTARP